MLKLTVLILFISCAAYAQTLDKQRLMNETCAVISQQRNAVSDASAMVEAQRRLMQERVDQWEVYFKAYVGG